jgi:hypothetical protein
MWYNPGQWDQQNVPEGERKPLGYFEENNINNLAGAGIHDGTFTKLRELSIAFQVSPDLLRGVPGLAGISGLSVRLSGQNLFTWSDYPGYDSDVGVDWSNAGSAVIARVDYYAYPHMRTFTGALEVVF